MTLSRGVCVKIGEFDNEMYINTPYGGDVKPVRCRGAWKSFYKRLACETTILDSTSARMDFYAERMMREIEDQLFHEVKADATFREDRDYGRMQNILSLSLDYCFIKTRALQALIQAALGDGKAREYVVRMLLEMEE